MSTVACLVEELAQLECQCPVPGARNGYVRLGQLELWPKGSCLKVAIHPLAVSLPWKCHSGVGWGGKVLIDVLSRLTVLGPWIERRRTPPALASARDET